MEWKPIYALSLIIVAIVAAVYIANTGHDPRIDVLETYEELPPQAQRLYYEQSEKLTKEVHPRIVELDQLVIGCFGPKTIMEMGDEGNLGGQCCGTLKDYDYYEHQIEAIEDFRNDHPGKKLIPPDPYDVSVEQAQELISYHYDIELEGKDKKTYDEAMELTHHGPCCCKCWKWYMMNGLGKKLIEDHGFNAEDVAKLWDISSSCGHDEHVDPGEHYESGHEH